MVTRRKFLKLSNAALAYLFGLTPSFAQLTPTLSSREGALGEDWELKAFPEMVMLQFDPRMSDAADLRSLAFSGILGQPLRAVSPLGSDIEIDKARGLIFPKGTRSNIQFDRISDPLCSLRWTILLFKVEPSLSRQYTILRVNDREPNAGWAPKITIERGKVVIVYISREPTGRPVSIALTLNGLVSDGKTPNCLLVYKRGGRIFARLNGETQSESQPDALTISNVYPSRQGMSILGDFLEPSPGWELGYFASGQSELSEEIALKLEASVFWSFGGQRLLPTVHPYAANRPRVESSDFPQRYRHDAERWRSWSQTIKGRSSEKTIGKARAEIAGFERVFYDDFSSNLVTSSASMTGQNKNWYGPGWNTTVGVDAMMVPPDTAPNVYEYYERSDDVGADGGMLNLSLKFDRGWKCGAIYSINNSGQGRAWKGPKIFRARIKYPYCERVPGGVFPGFWSYAVEPMFWRTAERIEVDFFEFDGRDDTYLNGGSSHVHKGFYPGQFNHLQADAPRVKLYSGQMTEKITGIPGGFHYCDGKWHTWEFAIDDEVSYLNVTVDKGGGKGEEWIELFRCSTPPEYLEMLCVILSQGLRKDYGVPEANSTFDMHIKYIEVLQKTSFLNQAAAPFVSTPILSGSFNVGHTISCAFQTEGTVEDTRYYWYADGFSRGFGLNHEYRLSPSDRGKRIRCMVKLVGIIDQPEAWSNAVLVD